jgi:hypothetical protein
MIRQKFLKTDNIEPSPLAITESKKKRNASTYVTEIVNNFFNKHRPHNCNFCNCNSVKIVSNFFYKQRPRRIGPIFEDSDEVNSKL